jgi:hypothetical protein
MDPVTVTGWLVLVAVSGATIRFFWMVRRHGAPIALSVAGALGLFSGLITAGLGVGHLGGVAGVELRRSPIRYDFRVYALLLLGVTLVVLGTRLAAASVGVPRGDGARSRRAVWAAVALLVVNVPLAPIQGFAVAVSIFVSIGLVALLAARARIAKAG